MSTYNLSSKSDMKRFFKDMEKQLVEMLHEIKCPNCGNKISVKAGNNVCKHCSAEIDVNFE